MHPSRTTPSICDRDATNVLPIVEQIKASGATSSCNRQGALNARGIARACGGVRTPVQGIAVLRWASSLDTRRNNHAGSRMDRMGHQVRRVATVVAALLLISESRPVLEVAAKLTATEFKQVVDIVRQRLDHFLSGNLASLESQRPLPQPEPVVSISTNAASGRPAARIKPDVEDIGQARDRRLAQLRVHAHQSAPEPEREIIVQRQSGDARRCYRLGKSMSLM
jgi:hypothetical protein